MGNLRNVLRRGATPLLLLAVFCGSAQAQQAVVKYLELKRAQDFDAALAVIRQEIASPPFLLRNPDYLANLRIIGIGALGDAADKRGLQPGMDDEAKRYFTEGLQYVSGNVEQEGNLRTVYARYFSDTKRNGLAIPRYRENFAFWKKRGNGFMVVHSLDALASGYHDMGETALARHFRLQALLEAEKYFVPQNKPTPHEYLQYSAFIGKHMDGIARTEPVEELDRWWEKTRAIAEKYLKYQSLSYQRAAKVYAIGGHLARAEKLLADARVHFEAESPGMADNLRKTLASDLAGASGTIHFFAGRYPQAVAELEAVHRFRTQAKVVEDDIAFHRLRGQAYEMTSDAAKAREGYLQSIGISEKLRQSYTVAERAAFFRSVVQQSYHGLIRVSARQAGGDAGIDKFWESVQASEMVRARQLGDLIEEGAPPVITRETLQAIRASLGPSRAVLYFTATERHLVILGFAEDRHVAHLEPLEPAFAEIIRKLARDLAQPGTPLEDIQSALAGVGRKMLAPLEPLIQGRGELIVLPDGVLNLVPFDLLSYQAEGYRALVDTHRVRLVPSLRFVGRVLPPVKSNGLLAVADPVYRSPAGVAGVERSDLEAATRGSRFLEYFKPLPETRTEADAIGRLFAGMPSQALLGDKASESQVKRAPLATYSILHFATHGILGGEVPGVAEPALVLASEESEDGFLTASEISSLKLDAQLAVLSACNTGSGEYVTGEGVMGLSRAFLLAGARAVVVSLWPVASQATERLMVAFYTHLRGGLDAHEALRRAKLQMRDDAAKAGSPERHPFFWAPFMVVGS